MGKDISNDVLMSSVFLGESSFQTRVENEFSIFLMFKIAFYVNLVGLQIQG
ncbi:hypothetical protein L085_13565 [Serratia sp. FS14]|nr:hypothetical protein L085_13565 [Serratia sp. FS14]